MPDIFVSYAREDKVFVTRLVDALKASGRDVWVDFEDIPFATDWWEEIQNGIEASNSVVFTISPDSLTSRYCNLEINYALKNNKRLIPLLYREPDGVQPPPEISALNWIFFKDQGAFQESVKQLLTTLDTDIDGLRQHTNLLMRARDWERKGHSRSLLLREDEIGDFERLMNAPNLTPLQRDFLLESQRRLRQLQILWRFVFGFIGGFLGMGYWAFSVFVSDVLLTPLRLVYALALGEVFGLFIGALAVLAGDLPERVEQAVRPPVLRVVKIVLCFIIGVVAWWVFRWFYGFPVMTTQDMNAVLFAGAGLAFGFVLRILFKLPDWLLMVVTALSIYAPIYITYERYFAGTNQFEPLIFFQARDQLFSVGIPLVILIALGANAHATIRQQLRTLFRQAQKVTP